MSIEKISIAKEAGDSSEKTTEEEFKRAERPTGSEIYNRALNIVSKELRGSFGMRGLDEIIQQVSDMHNTYKDLLGLKQHYPGWVEIDFLMLAGKLKDLKSGLESGDFTLEQVEEELINQKKQRKMNKKIFLIIVITIIAISLVVGASIVLYKSAFLGLKATTKSTNQSATTTATTAATSTLFEYVKTVKITPAGDFATGNMFARIGYVPGRDRFIVTFSSNLSKPQGGCVGAAYGYREYTEDMAETGKDGVISCHSLSDTGGLFVGDNFYLASMELQNGREGWLIAKYDAVTWKESASIFHPLTTLTDEKRGVKVESIEDPGDPMLAYVNGQIDISSTDRKNDTTTPWGPYSGAATHHQFFTTDLKFVTKRVLSDTPHINLSSMITTDGTTNFLTGTALFGDLVVLQYDSNWKYLGTRTLKQKSATPEGVAFDGTRFYVSYLNVPCTSTPCNTPTNVRLAAFDSNWNLLDDIAVTNFTIQDHKQTSRPTLALRNGRIYVAYDQAEDTTKTNAAPQTDDVQIYVKVYDVSGK